VDVQRHKKQNVFLKKGFCIKIFYIFVQSLTISAKIIYSQRETESGWCGLTENEDKQGTTKNRILNNIVI
jgi:hypothetical protein